MEVVPSLRFQLAVAPPGRLVAFKLTDPEKPFSLFTVTVYVPARPLLTVWLAGDAATEKSGGPAANTA